MDDRQLAEEAAGWLIRLESDSSPEGKAEFMAWLSRSPSHMEQFLLVTAAYRELEGVDGARKIEVDEKIGAFENVASIGAGGEAFANDPAGNIPPRKYARRRVVALAAAFTGVLCAVSVAWYGLSGSGDGQEFSTRTGEQRAIKLGDDSVVQLNTQSRVEVRLTEEVREVRLLEGEALFAVEHDPRRPFRVVTDSAIIQAIGTQFNVYRTHGGVTKVAVVQGAVKVFTSDGGSAQLSAGEEAIVAADGRVVTLEHAEVSRSIAWRQRKLDFRGTALSEVAGEFNRYNRVQIRIDDAVIAARELNGVFNADEPHALLDFLAQDPGVRFERKDHEIVVRRIDR